jgi:signal recognition particle subunit SEC65
LRLGKLMKLIEQYETIATEHLNERAAALHALLKDCRNLGLLQELGRREREKLRKRYKLSSLGTNLSRAGYYKRFRELKLIEGQNAIQITKADGSLTLQHAFIAECGLSAREWDDRNESDRVSHRLANPRSLNPTAILKRAADLIGSSDRRKIAIGLMIATGRRPHEIFARAKFDRIDGDNWHVRFSGQGKKRGNKPVFTIATLLPADQCRSALHRLRRDPYTKQVLQAARTEHPRNITAQNQAIDSRTNRSHNRAIAQHFADLIPQREGDQNITCKNLRAAYLVMATERDHHRSPIGQKMQYAACLAGHITERERPSDSDLQHIVTTLGYTDYHSPEVSYPETPRKPKLKRIEIDSTDLQQLDQWKEEWGTGSRHATLTQLIERVRQAPSILDTTALTDSTDHPPTPVDADRRHTPHHINPALVTDPQTQDVATETTTEQRITALEAKFEQMVERLSHWQDPKPPIDPPTISDQTVPAQAVTSTDTAPRSPRLATTDSTAFSQSSIQPSHPDLFSPPATAKTLAAKNAEAMARYESLSYGALTQTKGHGVSFARCQRVYEALQQYNEQYPDAAYKIAINKSLLRSVDGCSNKTASDWLEYFANDIADYHQSQGIEDPQYHNRNYHRGYDFPSEVKTFIR